MKRLALMGSWKRLGVQAGLLTGLGLAFVGGSEKPAVAGADCPSGGDCTFKKPNLLIVLDYSSSMNEDFQPGQTRWEAAIEAIDNIITTDNGFFDESMHIGLLRYGHDPDPDNEGSVISVLGQTDNSGLVDGVSLDVGWYDDENAADQYYECNGDAITDFLDNVEPPLCVGLNCAGIGTWTYGGLQAARDYVNQTRTDHPLDQDAMDPRLYFVMLMTDGVWTDQTGQAPINPDVHPDNPIPMAADIFDGQDDTAATLDDTPVYVVAFGDALGSQFADDVASAGGTAGAIDAGAGQLIPALEEVIDDIEQQVIIPECTSGLPRMMVILDGSSSMLNVGDVFDPPNYAAGGMGETGWDQARDALSGMASIFDVQVTSLDNQPVEDLVHLGLITFGSDGDERVLVDYGPCMKDNFGWALDPNTSCGAGCGDPWGGPPIIWTYQGPGAPMYPGFDQPTLSVMPDCNTGMFDQDSCTGSATATHTGLALANTNIQNYRAMPPALYPVDIDTQFINILITDGQYGLPGGSDDEEVAAELTDMFMNQGVTTYVIGFGSDEQLSDVELTNMACWGSGGSNTVPCVDGPTPVNYFTAANQDELSAALQQIIETVNFDPCCGFNDCSFNPEPTTDEVDPIPGEESSSGPGDSSSGGTQGLTSGSTSDGSSSSGDAAESSSSGDAESSSSGSSSGSSSSTTTPATTSTTSVDPTDESEADTGDTDDTSGALDDDGCGCSADSGGPRGALGSFLLLGMLGLVRRRRG